MFPILNYLFIFANNQFRLYNIYEKDPIHKCLCMHHPLLPIPAGTHRDGCRANRRVSS